ncbi:MAG TPA: sulfotransferase [Sulfuricurvum sp.]|nr:sulfotransferase [Sulfuricurvum sp.]
MNPLLITGAHRSGTTWIGNVLNCSNVFRYLDEPLNLEHSRHRLHGVQYWFEDIETNKKLIWQLKLHKLKSSLTRKRMLVKDPLSFFSIDSYIRHLDAHVLISVRHPAAFVGSLKRQNWQHDFNHFLGQKRLMKTRLGPFEKSLALYANEKQDIVQQGILLWNLIYSNALEYKKNYPDILLVRHEDLSLNPLDEFRKIFSYFNIPYTSAVQEYILETTKETNAKKRDPEEVHQLYRNSAENIFSYRTILSAKEISEVREGTQKVSRAFYDDATWS